MAGDPHPGREQLILAAAARLRRLGIPDAEARLRAVAPGDVAAIHLIVSTGDMDGETRHRVEAILNR